MRRTNRVLSITPMSRAVDEHTSWGALYDRAVCAIAESRSLVAERKRLLDELVLNCQHRREAARQAAQGLRKAEANLVANYRRWFPNGEASQAHLQRWRSSAASPEYADKAGVV
jgi:hypothetical protein